jgi:hypothetical protein
MSFTSHYKMADKPAIPLCRLFPPQAGQSGYPSGAALAGMESLATAGWHRSAGRMDLRVQYIELAALIHNRKLPEVFRLLKLK